MVENAKIEKFKWDILADFQTMFGYENIVDQTSQAKWSDFITKVFAALFLGGSEQSLSRVAVLL